MNVCTLQVHQANGRYRERGVKQETEEGDRRKLKLTMVGELGGECGMKKSNTGECSQLHFRLVLVLVLIMLGTYRFEIAAGRRYHTHGDAVGVCVSVSRRIAAIHLWVSGGSGLSKLHLSSEGTL
jgi:hypothetical protein